MTRRDTLICGICLCTFGDGDCVHLPGRGTTDDPFVPTPVIHPDEDNLIECGPAGLAAFLPPIYRHPPACLLYSTINHTIAFDVAQGLFFNEERYDTDSMHSDEDQGRVIIKTPGLYFASIVVRWSKTNNSAATGDLATFIRKNGAELLAFDSMPVPEGDSFAKQSVQVSVPMRTGDFLDVLVKQDVEIDDKEKTLSITAERMSPNFAVTYVRRLKGMNILGMPESID